VEYTITKNVIGLVEEKSILLQDSWEDSNLPVWCAVDCSHKLLKGTNKYIDFVYVNDQNKIISVVNLS